MEMLCGEVLFARMWEDAVCALFAWHGKMLSREPRLQVPLAPGSSSASPGVEMVIQSGGEGSER